MLIDFRERGRKESGEREGERERERGREREGERERCVRERNINLLPLTLALTGDRTAA